MESIQDILYFAKFNRLESQKKKNQNYPYLLPLMGDYIIH